MKRWGDIVSGMGALLFSLLSCAFCPLCLPIYAGLLGIIGIEIGNFHTFLLPATAIFALSSLGFMAYQTYTHKAKWLPFKVALVAVFAMLAAAVYDLDVPLYIALAVFVGAIFWNKRLIKHKGRECC